MSPRITKILLLFCMLALFVGVSAQAYRKGEARSACVKTEPPPPKPAPQPKPRPI